MQKDAYFCHEMQDRLLKIDEVSKKYSLDCPQTTDFGAAWWPTKIVEWSATDQRRVRSPAPAVKCVNGSMSRIVNAKLP